MKITKAKLRQIIREELLREIGPGAGMAPTQQYGLGMRGGISDDTPQEVQEYLEAGKLLVQILDPTAITTLIDPEYHEMMTSSRKEYKDAKTADAKTLALGMLLLGAAAAIPVVGRVLKVGSVAARGAARAGSKASQRLARDVVDTYRKSTSKVHQALQRALKKPKAKPKKVPKGAKSAASRAPAASVINNSARKLQNMKTGTHTLTEDMYAFVYAPAGRVKGGKLGTSKGMPSDKAEDLLQQLKPPNAVPRQSNTKYLATFPEGSGWADWGQGYVVKIPKGSKITIADGEIATEVSSRIGRRGEDAAGWAQHYWESDRKLSGASAKYGEVMTQAEVQVVGKIDDLLGDTKSVAAFPHDF